tara:strand:- start:9052 stop:10287 length:1236 start_codon:yes stop_codon:yes gene_type:complete
MSVPIKLSDTNGNLKEMTTTEEAYLSYQAGLHLAAQAQTAVAALTTSNSSSTNIGTYSNTFFNQAIGTHPGSGISTGTTNTVLYQKSGTPATNGGDFHRPITWDDDNTATDEFTDANMNTLLARLSAVVFANNYPGTYKLASSTPGSDYDEHLADVFTDTQASNGSTITHSIWQRQTMTAPTAVRPVKIKNDSSSFDGLQEMDDAEIKHTFGTWLRKYTMAAANNIGAYQLRSSASGVPSATGTWQAQGTATDTKKTTSDVNYSADYSGTYSATYSADYSGTYAGTYSADYSGTYAGTYSADYINPDGANFQRVRHIPGYNVASQTYVANFLGPATFTGNYVGNYTGAYTGNYVGNYTGAYTGNYVGNYTGAYTGNYVGNYTGAYTGNYAGETIGSGVGTIETYTLYVRKA